MSDEHSNFDKDPNKKPKKKNEGAQSTYQQQPQKKPHKPKDYQVLFEPKSSEKPLKDQQPPNKSNPQPSSKEEYSNKGSKQENQPPHKPKQHKPSNKESREQASGSARRKYDKISKNTILEFYHRAQPLEDLGNLLTLSSQLFIKEKQTPVNEEVFELDPNEGLMPKFSHPSTANTSTTSSTQSVTQPIITQTATTTTVNNTTPVVSNSNTNTLNNTNNNSNASSTGNVEKPMEMFDLSKDRFDPIQAMRQKMKMSSKPAPVKFERAEVPERKGIEEEKKKEEVGIKRAEPPKEETKTASNPVETQPKEQLQEKAEKEEEIDLNEERYSDIDTEFEKKLKNNGVQNNEGDEEEDSNQQQREQFLKTEDRSRPEWEDIDSREGGQYENQLLQDKRIIFGDQYLESKGGSSPSKKGNDRDVTQTKQDPNAKSTGYGDITEQSEQQRLLEEYYRSMGRQQNLPRGEDLGAQLMQQINPQAYNKAMQQMQMQGRVGSSQEINMQKANAQSAQNVQTQQKVAQSQAQSQPQKSSGGYPTFVFKYFSPDYDMKFWNYIDLEGNVQGPYSGRTMDEWYSKGYLPLDLKVTYGKSNSFRSLKDLIEVLVVYDSQDKKEGAQKEQAPTKASPNTSQDYLEQGQVKGQAKTSPNTSLEHQYYQQQTQSQPQAQPKIPSYITTQEQYQQWLQQQAQVQAQTQAQTQQKLPAGMTQEQYLYYRQLQAQAQAKASSSQQDQYSQQYYQQQQAQPQTQQQKIPSYIKTQEQYQQWLQQQAQAQAQLQKGQSQEQQYQQYYQNQKQYQGSQGNDGNYGQNAQAYYANKGKASNQPDYSAYYGQGSQGNTGSQYSNQANQAYGNYGKNTSQSYQQPQDQYSQYDNYYGQESQNTPTSNYGGAYKTAQGQGSNTANYYQGQGAYGAQQKAQTQFKGNYQQQNYGGTPTSASGYGSQYGGQQGESWDYGNQGESNQNVMYMLQQQQQQYQNKKQQQNAGGYPAGESGEDPYGKYF